MYKTTNKSFQLYYSIPAIANEADKRTSLLGKRIDTETKKYLMEQVRLTEDDRDVFDSFLKEVYAEVIEQLSSHIHEKKMHRAGEQWLRTPNGLHLVHRPEVYDEAWEDTKKSCRFLFITDDTHNLVRFEPSVMLTGGVDVVFDEDSKKYYLATEDTTVMDGATMEHNPSLWRIPFFDCIVLNFSRDQHLEDGILPAIDIAVQSAFAYGVIYRWLAFGGYNKEANDIILPFYNKSLQDAFNRLLIIHEPYKRDLTLF